MLPTYRMSLFMVMMLVVCALSGCSPETMSGDASAAASAPLPADVHVVEPHSRPQRRSVQFPDAVPTLEVQVLGNVPQVDFNTWQRIPITLRQSDELYIKAAGIVGYVGKLADGPDGEGRTYSPSLMPALSFVSLVGRAGDELLTNELITQPDSLYGPGFVGSEFYWVKRYRNWGNLYLAVNDSADGDNTGAFDVKIWIVRDGKVVPPQAAVPKQANEQQ